MTSIQILRHLLFCMSLLPVGSTEPPRPRIYCSRPIQDLGSVPKGTRLERSFEIENRGDAPLRITEIQVSCDCTTVPLTTTVVEPGASIPLVARFDSTNLEGSIEKSILVMSDDPSVPVLPLGFRGRVVNPYALEPSAFHFQSIGRNSGMERRATLTRVDGKPLLIRSVSVVNDDALETRFEPKAASQSWDVILKVRPGARPHPVNARVRIALEDPNLPILEANILGQIVEDIGVFPQRLDFGSARRGQVLEGRVLITLHHPGIEIGALSIEPLGLEAESAPRKNLPGLGTHAPKAIEIRIRVREDAPLGPLDGRLLIRTSSADQGLIAIPLSGKITAE